MEMHYWKLEFMMVPMMNNGQWNESSSVASHRVAEGGKKNFTNIGSWFMQMRPSFFALISSQEVLVHGTMKQHNKKKTAT